MKDTNGATRQQDYFVRHEGGSDRIALDGTGLKQITPGDPAGWSDENPQFSPDGRKLAYNKLREGLSCLLYTSPSPRD